MCVNIRPTENSVDGPNRLAYTGRGNGASPPKDGVRPHAPSMHSRAGCMLCGGVEAGPACAEPASFHPHSTSRTVDRPYDLAAKLTALRPDRSRRPVAPAGRKPRKRRLEPQFSIALQNLAMRCCCLGYTGSGSGRMPSTCRCREAGTGLDHAAARTGSLRKVDRDASSAVLTLRELET